MAGGAALLDPNRRKIKGKKLTVLRFFTVSVAYTIGWYTISSELDYFKHLFGPQILLQLNIAYYLPSIPLLLISGQYDEMLEERFGVVPVVLTRLVVGLVGCSLLTALFPLVFHLHHEGRAHLAILGITVVLGLCTGTAFSASYQLVSRFANKNVIALGLGFVGSGIMTLVIQVVLELLQLKQWLRQLLLYEIVTAITLLGLSSALTILFRKWREIEDIAASERATLKAAASASISNRQQHASGCGAHVVAGHLSEECAENTASQHAAELGVQNPVTASATELPAVMEEDSRPSVWEGTRVSWSAANEGSIQRSISVTRLPSLAAFDFTDPYHSLPLWDAEGETEPFQPGSLPDVSFFSPARSHSRSTSRRISLADGLSTPLLHDASAAHVTGSTVAAAPVDSSGHEAPVTWEQAAGKLDTAASREWRGAGPDTAPAVCQDEGASQLWEIIGSIWPIAAAMFLSGVTILVVFPFFTYVESSGWAGERLPKVLFFVRLFADIVGRLMPRLRFFSLSAPYAILSLATLKFATVPAYFWYLKAPATWRCDALIIGYIVVIWLLCGYINTLCNISAPKLVKPNLKSGAAGLMAVTFQLSHFTGLVVAIAVSYALFGGLAKPH